MKIKVLLLGVLLGAIGYLAAQQFSGPGNVLTKLLVSGGNCVSAASPAVCGSFSIGFAAIPAAASIYTINTTAVTANSLIIVEPDQTLGTILSVTCNTTLNNIDVNARSAGTSFGVITNAPVTNPECFSYMIIN